MTKEERQEAIFDLINVERIRQDKKWGYPQYKSMMDWAAILTEENGEASQAALNWKFAGESKQEIIKEAIHTAAVAVAWADAIMSETVIEEGPI